MPNKIINGLTLSLVTLALAAIPAQAATIIDFEGLADSTPIGTTYSALGITFTNALVITAGISLNELEFPPTSGQNAVIDNGGPIQLAFASPVSSFFAYFTYASPLTLTAYDSANDVLTSAVSAFSQNFVSSGNPPDESISLTYSTGIDHITIAGDPAGGSFVMDDVTFNTSISSGGPSTPEPRTLLLSLIAFSALVTGGRSPRNKINL